MLVFPLVIVIYMLNEIHMQCVVSKNPRNPGRMPAGSNIKFCYIFFSYKMLKIIYCICQLCTLIQDISSTCAYIV